MSYYLSACTTIAIPQSTIGCLQHTTHHPQQTTDNAQHAIHDRPGADHIDSNLKATYLANLKIDSEREIRDASADLTTRLYAVHHLNSALRQNPGLFDTETIMVLRDVLKDSRLAAKRQSLFFFRLAAETLCSALVHCRAGYLADFALAALKDVMANTCGYSHRATTEAFACLPFSVRGPVMPPSAVKNVPKLTWDQLLAETGYRLDARPAVYGRSIVVGINSGSAASDGLMVVKLLPGSADPTDLLTEACWMEYFNTVRFAFPVRFDIPELIRIKGAALFRLAGLPPGLSANCGLPRAGYAICFAANQDYFNYPNDSDADGSLDIDGFKSVLFRDSWLMGKLAAMGILHLAPIPLFHNRIQVNRRRDRGLYEWYRAGRLDRWLDSCKYPNLGVTGIRDFEHMISFNGSNQALYRHIGNHFLSLMLIAGSYFRSLQPELVGFTERGRPVDARFLFDRPALENIVSGVFLNYYDGFVGSRFDGPLPLDLPALAGRMIEEMGVDRHMEEFLRVADQKEMPDNEFREFLKSRGLTPAAVERAARGENDIRLFSGPHLGGFNQPISLPELIECVAAMSALCLFGRFNNTRQPGPDAAAEARGG